MKRQPRARTLTKAKPKSPVNRRVPSKKQISKELDRRFKAAASELIAVPVKAAQPWISMDVLAKSRLKTQQQYIHPFVVPQPPPLPRGVKRPNGMAFDQQIIEVNAWAEQAVYNGAFYNGQAFMGYPYLSELAQRPEYRRLVEVLSTEMTRKWITLKSRGDDQRAKKDKIDQLTQYMDQKLAVRDVMRKVIELDGWFGRAHIYIDTGEGDELEELCTPIGDGSLGDPASDMKFKGKMNFLKAFRVVEPVWCYPAKYNAIDPLREDWYNPQTWFVQGKELHVSRILVLVGREVPDLLKPSYNFGGLSLSQLAKPYVDNWLRTRQAVADLIWTFSVMVLKTDLSALLGSDGMELFKRAALFSNLRTNQGLMMVNKDTEDLINVAAPVSGLEGLQAQSQEHMCSVTGTPVVKLLGIQPAGLNASSEGELTTWYDWVAAYQEKFIRRPLTTLINLCQRSLWGQVDPDIYFEFEQLEEMSEKELADLQKTLADTDAELIQAGIIDPLEVRQAMANDPNSRYSGIEVEDLPQAPGMEGMEGEQDGGDLQSQLGPIGERGPDARRDAGRDPDDSADRTDGEQRRGKSNGEAGAPRPRINRPPQSKARTPEARTREPRPPRSWDT